MGISSSETLGHCLAAEHCLLRNYGGEMLLDHPYQRLERISQRFFDFGPIFHNAFKRSTYSLSFHDFHFVCESTEEFEASALIRATTLPHADLHCEVISRLADWRELDPPDLTGTKSFRRPPSEIILLAMLDSTVTYLPGICE
jgi:hypothetical protein